MGCLTNTMSVGMKHDMSLARDLEWYKNRIFKFFFGVRNLFLSNHYA